MIEKQTINRFCKAMKGWHPVKLFYNKQTKNNAPGWRLFEPYLVGIQKNGNTIVSGWFIPDPQVQTGQEQKHENYTLKDITDLKILPGKFDEIKISIDKIVNTKLKIICKIIE